MAKKKAPVTARRKRTEAEELLIKIRRRAATMFEADRENRTKALDDLEFLHIPGKQWDQSQRLQRGDRPCYEYNKLRVTTKRIVNDMRANRPQGKIRAVEDNDKDTAEVFEGLIRNIWNISDGDTVIDYAAEYQVGGGMGAWRIRTEESDYSFTKDIKIESIKNPFCLFADPACVDPLKRDAADWILTERISKAAFEKRWPDAVKFDFEDVEFDDEEDWGSDDDGMVRICEYWWKEPYDKEIWQLKDGKVVDAQEDIDPAQVIQRRMVECNKIMMCIASGNAILDQATVWAGSEFPFVQIYGEWIVINGRIHWFGLTRFAKDAQRSYNVARTAISETVAAAPQAKFWATADQAVGHTDKWAEAHKKLYPFLLYNADPMAPGPPMRMGGADIPVALMQESEIASEEIKAVTGIYDASLGNQTNETSGIAIRSRQMQGEIATFNFSDNMAKGIRRTWELLIDVVPKVYDTARVVRVLGVDGAEKYVKINTMEQDAATGEMRTLNDLGTGKFDVTVSTGPSFSTQRQEASETFTDLAKAFPPIMQVAGDLVFKAMDVPYSDKFAERMKLLLPPQVQQQEAQGKPLPPEVQAAMAQADQAMQQVQQQGQLVQQAAEEAKEEQAAAKQAKADAQAQVAQIDVKMANLKVQEANLATDVANFKTLVAETQAKMGDTQDAQVVQQDREFLGNQIQSALTEIQQRSQEFAQQAMGMIQQFHVAHQPQIIVPGSSKRKQVRVKRVDGELIGEIQDVAEPEMAQ